MRYSFTIDQATLVPNQPTAEFATDADAIFAALEMVRGLIGELPEEQRGGHYLTVTREDGVELCRINLGPSD